MLAGILLCAAASCANPKIRPDEWRRTIKYPGNMAVKVVWRTQITDRSIQLMDADPLEDGIPVRDDKYVYVGGRSKKLFKINARTGQVAAKKKLQEEVYSQPLIVGDMLYLGDSSGYLIAFDKHNLRELWKYEANSEIIAPVVHKDGVLYFVTQKDTLTAISADEGVFKWEYREEFHGTMSVRRHAAPLILEDKVVTGFTVGTIAAFDLVHGKMMWRRDLGESDRFNDVDATPVYHDGHIYTASFDGSVYCLNAKTGLPVWKTKLKSASTVLILRDKLYLTSTDNGLYCLEIDTGKISWNMKFKNVIHKSILRDDSEGALSRPVQYNDKYLVFASSGTGLYFIDYQLQRMIEAFTPGVGIASEPTTHENIVYVLTNGGYLYALSLAPKGHHSLAK